MEWLKLDCTFSVNRRLRSQGEFFREDKDLSFRSLGQKSNKSFKDKYLREALIVSAHTRNMGL